MKKLKKIQDGIWKTDSKKTPYQLDCRPRGHNGKRFKKAFLTLGIHGRSQGSSDILIAAFHYAGCSSRRPRRPRGRNPEK